MREHNGVSTKRDKRCFALAKACSKKSIYKVRVGCVIIRGGRVIARGFNKNRTSPKHKYSIHAECDAINNLPNLRNINRAIVYIYRESNGKPALSKPCDDCMEILNNMGFKKILWSNRTME